MCCAEAFFIGRSIRDDTKVEIKWIDQKRIYTPTTGETRPRLWTGKKVLCFCAVRSFFSVLLRKSSEIHKLSGNTSARCYPISLSSSPLPQDPNELPADPQLPMVLLPRHFENLP